MQQAVEETEFLLIANIIEAGLTENLSAKQLAHIGFVVAVYPFTMVAAKIKAVRAALESLKDSFSTGAPEQILSANNVYSVVVFTKY